jgi:hypothetical protein
MRCALRNADQEKGALTAPVIELAVEIFELVRSLIYRSPVRSMVVHRGLSLGDLIEQFLSLRLQFQGSSNVHIVQNRPDHQFSRTLPLLLNILNILDDSLLESILVRALKRITNLEMRMLRTRPKEEQRSTRGIILITVKTRCKLN